MRYVVALLLISGYSCLHAQNNPIWKLPLYFSDYPKKYVYPPDTLKLFDTLRLEYDRQFYFKIVLKDTRGECFFQAYNNNRLSEWGNYINSLDTLKQYTSSRGRVYDDKLIGKKVFKYFEPLRHGEWSFYTTKGIISKEYIYGVEVKSNF